MTRFVVRRLPWMGKTADLLRGPVTVSTFTDEADALADCRTREAAARKHINPFECLQGRLAELTSLTHRMLGDYALDGGLEPPRLLDNGTRDWAGWWREGAATWSEQQRAHIWLGLDRLHLFDVVEQSGPGKVYLLLQIGWRYSGSSPCYTDPGESRHIVAAFTTREKAEAHRAELEKYLRNHWPGPKQLSRPDWPGWPQAVGNVDTSALFDILETDWEAEE